MTENLKVQILRVNHNIDLEIQPVQTMKEGEWTRTGYRYIISQWNKKDKLVSRVYSDPANAIFDTYEAAEANALNYIEQNVVKI